MKQKILFTKTTINFILEALGYKTDKQGFVVNHNNEFIFDVDGFKFKPKDIIGIVNNQFVTKELQLLNLK